MKTQRNAAAHIHIVKQRCTRRLKTDMNSFQLARIRLLDNVNVAGSGQTGLQKTDSYELEYTSNFYIYIYKINTSNLLIILVLIVQVQMQLGPKAW